MKNCNASRRVASNGRTWGGGVRFGRFISTSSAKSGPWLSQEFTEDESSIPLELYSFKTICKSILNRPKKLKG
jgi:hypothetical protein